MGAGHGACTARITALAVGALHGSGANVDGSGAAHVVRRSSADDPTSRSPELTPVPPAKGNVRE